VGRLWDAYFCEGIRNNTIWNKVKEHILKPGVTYTLSLIVEYVKVQVQQLALQP